MFDGIEVDVFSLGDADCIVVTQWYNSFPHRILIDGGSGRDAEAILDWLRTRGFTLFWAVVCTHLHKDHARGLIKVVQNKAITIQNAWMHDIRRHINADALRRSCAADDAVNEIFETTGELAAAFAFRGIARYEPFTGSVVAGWPNMTVLGPTTSYYDKTLQKITNMKVPAQPSIPAQAAWSALAALAGDPPPVYRNLANLFDPALVVPSKTNFGGLFPPISSTSPGVPALPILGALAKSSVQENPATQPYNNTSVILGMTFKGGKLLFTGDAGSEALSYVDANWHHLLYLGVPHHGSDGNLSQTDIERFCPQFAVISAKGDSSHPSRSIVSGLVKVGAKVASTHRSGNLWFYSGLVPPRPDYGPVEFLEGTGNPEPVDAWMRILSGCK